MTDSERRQRLITSTPHLAPEEVANRTFGTARRGYAEAEVRSFLKRLSEQMAAERERERELTSAIDALEEQLRQPRPLSEKELLDQLGEETARLLRSAREAGDDIRKKAEERAAQIIEEANAQAARIKAEAEEIAARRLHDGEARAAALVAAAESDAQDARDAIAAEGREMLDEAKAARERVLTDLVRRRALLNGQIEELRAGRDRLLDAYRTVKRTFLEATEALAQVEARAAAERSAPGEPLDIAAEVAAEIEALDAATTGETPAVDANTSEVVDLVEADTSDDARDDDATTSGLADVDSLFARIRAGQPAQPSGTDAPAAEAEAEPAGAVATETEPAEAAEPAAEAEPVPAADDIRRVSATDWRATRARELDPLLAPLVKKTKRTVQDDQNALLDAVRRHKGRPNAEQVLPDLDALLASWGYVMRDAVDKAYRAGLAAAGAEPRDASADLVREAAEGVVTPLRARIKLAIDDGEEGDAGGLVERIGARYREWKNQSLERTLAEVLDLVWSRGVYDAVPDGAVLWWIPFEEGRCSDCDDNGLEPTVKGKDFPTGQPFPPAHPGCRCLLAPAELLNTSTAS